MEVEVGLDPFTHWVGTVMLAVACYVRLGRACYVSWARPVNSWIRPVT